MIKIYNTLTKKKEIFKPNNLGKVSIYVCGVTPYDLCHIGHGRTFTIFDVIIRYMRYIGYNVNYVRNITDIDDKIIDFSKKNNKSFTSFSQKMIDLMNIDFDNLNIVRPNYEPKVTDHINDIINLIIILIKNKNAYIASNGDVMFSVSSSKSYGILSNQKVDKLKFIINNDLNIDKKSKSDFVLWKKNKVKDHPKWHSPWGLGRPGWHIECSAISHKYLGCNFDIHGGGSDLIFPHHENEIAQSQSAYKCYCSNIWMHTGMIMSNNNKMSKSLNNFLTIKNLLSIYNFETLRFFFMSSHYRNPIIYCEENIKKAFFSLQKFYIALDNIDESIKPHGGEDFIEKFNIAMNDDFNTPKVHSILFKMVNKINKLKYQKSKLAHGVANTLRKILNILGFIKKNGIFLFKQNSIKNKHIHDKINILIKQRTEARKNCEWLIADKIRHKLLNMNILIEDTIYGTKWRYK
ncbi:MAG: cysteine--tRNA ligase [Enterobacterales bacterium]